MAETSECKPFRGQFADPTVGHRSHASVARAAVRNFCLSAVANHHLEGSLNAPSFAFATSTVDITDTLGYSMPSHGPYSHAVTAAYALAVAVQSTADMGDVPIPKGFRKAMQSEHSAFWSEAVNKELSGLIDRGTWDVVLVSDIPSGSNVMRCHYVFTVKRKSDGSVDRFKARLVADGNSQRYKVDFDRVFAAVVRPTTLRLMLTIAAAKDYNLTQIDVVQAYLQAEITEPLYMRVPEGLPTFDDEGRPLVLKLKRGLYGCKQSGRLWSETLSEFLVGWGFQRSHIDVCLYTYCKGSSILWLCWYVDDAVLADNDSQLRDRFVADLHKRFPIDDRGELEWVLGISVTRDRTTRSLTLSQKLYVADIVTRYASFIDTGITRKFDTPLPEGIVMTPDDSPKYDSPEWHAMATKRPTYMSIVGALLWLANMTYPQLGYATSQLARFVTNPGKIHFDMAIRVLVYVKGAENAALESRS